MSNNDAVIEFLFNQLQQQLTNNPYKQQCEDLAHEVQSLKNQLRDMSEVVDELMGTITLMNGKSSCRKEDAQECEHDWLHSKHKSGFVCFKCGAREECEHDWEVKTYPWSNETYEYCPLCREVRQ
ncbi:hypothetical protein SJ619_13335 [Enterococcus faecium]